MIAYRATLDVPRELVHFVARLLWAERRCRGTPKVNGSWHTAIEVPGIAALNQGGNAAIGSVSCASAGNCGAGGFYADSSGHAQAFVASQT